MKEFAIKCLIKAGIGIASTAILSGFGLIVAKKMQKNLNSILDHAKDVVANIPNAEESAE